MNFTSGIFSSKTLCLYNKDIYFTWYGFGEVNVKEIVNENVFQ